MAELNTLRNPPLPSIPQDGEIGNKARIRRWRSELLDCIRRISASVYDDLLEGSFGTSTTGLFELDTDGNLMPILGTETDVYFELDVDDNLEPVVA